VLHARSDAVKELAKDMLTHKVKGLNTYWGSGEENTLLDENEVVGRGKRQKGFPRNTLLAAFLDPRSKTLKGFGIVDKNKIWNQIKIMMHAVAEETDRAQDATVVIDVDIVVPNRDRKSLADLFNGIGEEDVDEDNTVSTNDHKVDNEFDKYQSLKGLTVMLLGDVISDPLNWWQLHEGVLPILSTLARRMLCVPATSAPSERVFSVAGLTISKCRTSVQSQHASDLIFLHDSWLLALECELELNKKK
jgi:zinc finger BED domain-containing protein 1 (E3 SUMO-protein ligase ZBED1)